MSYLQISHTYITIIAMYCYSLHLNWLQKVHVLMVWYLAWAAGSWWNSKRQCPGGDFQVLRPCPERLSLSPFTCQCQMMNGSALPDSCQDALSQPKVTGPINHGRETLRPWDKTKLSSSEVYHLGIHYSGRKLIYMGSYKPGTWVNYHKIMSQPYWRFHIKADILTITP